VKHGTTGIGISVVIGADGRLKSASQLLSIVVAQVNGDLKKLIDEAAKKCEPNPTEKQKETGNYRKGKVTVRGLPITIETGKGQTRSGKSSDGVEWSIKMKHHYGYIRLTESDADGDHIDVFIGDNPESEVVFVVDQNWDGEFDEHKVMVGFTNEKAAREGYLSNYEPGWKGLGSVTALTWGQFKEWLSQGKSDRPVSSQVVDAALFG